MKKHYSIGISIKPVFIFLLVSSVIISSCKNDYTPKPRGYLKVSYPVKAYTRFETDAPFSFELPVYSQIVPDSSPNAEQWWYNILFPDFDGTIYLSYKSIDDNLGKFIEDSRILAYKHSIKAESIEETPVINNDIPLFGIIYDLKGNTASSLQFFLTDSINHFLRGSLYFNTTPNQDSLAPVVSFLREDLEVMINSFEWN